MTSFNFAKLCLVFLIYKNFHHVSGFYTQPMLSARFKQQPVLKATQPTSFNISTTPPLKINDKAYDPVYSESSRFLSSTKTWWNLNTANRSGLLIYLVPAVLSQLIVLDKALPFVINRVVQYVQPTFIALLFSLSSLRSIRLVQTIMLASISTGIACMLVDTYQAGANWAPLHAKCDSYALITG